MTPNQKEAFRREVLDDLWYDATNAVCQTMQEQNACNCPDGHCIASKVEMGAKDAEYSLNRLRALAASQPAPATNLCDCELSHNGLGVSGRECDCPAGQPAPLSSYEDVFQEPDVLLRKLLRKPEGRDPKKYSAMLTIAEANAAGESLMRKDQIIDKQLNELEDLSRELESLRAVSQTAPAADTGQAVAWIAARLQEDERDRLFEVFGDAFEWDPEVLRDVREVLHLEGAMFPARRAALRRKENKNAE